MTLKVSPQIEPIELDLEILSSIPDVALRSLTPEEQKRILEVARKEAILNIYTQLRVR
jgi:hypothetical protein